MRLTIRRQLLGSDQPIHLWGVDASLHPADADVL